ncbi:alpha/beta hydrolase [Flavivirga sp. 57AJ16]|uniref:alpha/beta hydrolase n=1 Tax=Flavivirga sp. 57AJ16 TaxID=3025307 RepID=UPI0023660CC2|nr:alpha/beta hydrolase [Flavivirga sp. 57AJ16]MDD7887540.1 alpha/beta hydrolase [Flavivirga sp. 57AJ16]
MKLHRLIITTLFFISVLTLKAQTGGYIDIKDIDYYGAEMKSDDYRETQCKLDIYYPQNEEDVPVVIWFHGGGLTGGQKEIPAALKGAGFCVVGVGYRLSPTVPAKTSIEDAAQAIAWVFENIENYNGSRKKIFVSGHSAGGYLSLMTVMNKEYLNKYGIDSNKIVGLVPFSGHTITHFTIRSESNIPDYQPIIDEFAPLYYIRKDAPSILLITGDRELEMLGRYEENAYFYRMMKVIGHKDIEIFEMDGYNHGMTYPAFPLLVKFIRSKCQN